MQNPSNPPDSEIMSYLVRMVTPMKREFNIALDVNQFLHDVPYAKEVIKQGLESKDERLRGYVVYIESRLFGPRSSGGSSQSPAPTASKPAAKPVDPKAAESEKEQQAKVLAKYTSGLR